MRKVMDSSDMQPGFIYFDYNATTPLADEVIEGIQESLVNDWGNPSSLHSYGARAKLAVGKARKQIADMLNCSSSEIIFTSGGTESNNMVIYSALRSFKEFKRLENATEFDVKPHIITTNVEHDSILLPIKQLEEQGAVTYTAVKVTNNGCINVDDVISSITDHTCLITVMYANNETGVIMPVAELGKKLKHVNVMRKNKKLKEILYHTDAAQMIGKELVDFQASNVDLMTVVGHKFYGPRIGCLVSREKVYPMFFGGGQENGLRPGTENTPMIVGLGIAAELVAKNLKIYRENMIQCRIHLESRLKEMFGNEIVIHCGESERLPNTVNFSFKSLGLEGALVLSRCKHLIASVGAACHVNQCSQILINSGIPRDLARNAIRLSLGRNTTPKDIELIVLDLFAAVSALKADLSI